MLTGAFHHKVREDLTIPATFFGKDTKWENAT